MENFCFFFDVCKINCCFFCFYNLFFFFFFSFTVGNGKKPKETLFSHWFAYCFCGGNLWRDFWVKQIVWSVVFVFAFFSFCCNFPLFFVFDKKKKKKEKEWLGKIKKTLFYPFFHWTKKFFLEKCFFFLIFEPKFFYFFFDNSVSLFFLVSQ